MIYAIILAGLLITAGIVFTVKLFVDEDKDETDYDDGTWGEFKK